MKSFQTLKKIASIEGVGLHSGQQISLNIVPSREGGLAFIRTDLSGQPSIPAGRQYIGNTVHATVLEKDGVKVSTPEHLLAALWSYGITHAKIELNGPEIPILDGSARQWCELIEATGIQTLAGFRPQYSLREPVAVHEGNACVLALPYDSLRVTADVEYGVGYLAPQTASCEVISENFREQLAPARTFTLEKWIEPLRSQGLIQGGSLDNALVLAEDAPLTPLRFENELARHKALDAIGDLSLLFGENGGVLHAHIIAIRAGHELHRRWMEEAVRIGALIDNQ
jgi:UDP-3-O-[3-hydroxymyristoyl] N-acetylglucosamine deacetylase